MIFGMNGYGSLGNERNRRVSSRQTRHFSASGQKSPQKTPPQMSPATVVATCIPQSFPGRSHALRLTSRQSPGNDCSTPVETKGGWKSEAKTSRYFGSLEKIGLNHINPSALPIPQPLSSPVREALLRVKAHSTTVRPVAAMIRD